MEETSAAQDCPQCGAPLARGAETCAACGRDNANPFTSPAAHTGDPAPRGFNLQLLFAVVTVICVSLAIGILLPGLGVFFAIVFVPAVIRAAAVLRRRHAAGLGSNSTSQVALALLASAGTAFLVWQASSIAFVMICIPTSLVAALLFSQTNVGGDIGMIVAFGFSGLAGLATYVWLMRRFWPRPAEDENETA